MLMSRVMNGQRQPVVSQTSGGFVCRKNKTWCGAFEGQLQIEQMKKTKSQKQKVTKSSANN